MDIKEIRNAIPHRYPFLLVDKVVEIEPKKRIVVIKNVTINEPFFNGHFPDHPIMPGVLIAEAMAQAGCLMMTAGDKEEAEPKLAVLMGLNNFKFRKPVLPGDQLVMEVEALRIRKNFGKIKGVARVDGNVVTEGEIAFGLTNSNEL